MPGANDNCLFCDTDREPLVIEDQLCYAVIDSYPVAELHTLIIPKRHVASYFDLYRPEIDAMHQALTQKPRFNGAFFIPLVTDKTETNQPLSPQMP